MQILDPYGVTGDPALPGIAAALDPVAMARRLRKQLRRRLPAMRTVRVLEIRVVRHKPGRRCLIEYELELAGGPTVAERIALLGKVRALGYPKTGCRRLEAFWNAGFAAHSADGISVPEPLGWIGELGIWFQRKVPGRPAAELLRRGDAVRCVAKIAEAAHKIHSAQVPAERSHTIADEIRILHERLPEVAALHPDWAGRIERLLGACQRLGASIPQTTPKGIHRDFYADQVIVDGGRLTLVDFDLYCMGDPGLDIGNFIGHVTEQALRETGDPASYRALEMAMAARFWEVAGKAASPAVSAYADLTLVRHIYLSTRFEERRRLTRQLLELCEERMRAWL